jgi:hypothetical protein
LFEKEEERYCGLTIKWNYSGKMVPLLMPSYVEKALKRFQHPPPIAPQEQPHQHVKKMYCAKFQHANLLDDSPPLNEAGKKFIQEVMGVFLYLSQAADLMMLTMLSVFASKQVAPTEKNNAKMPPIFRLCSITRRRHRHLQSKRYETCNT